MLKKNGIDWEKCSNTEKTAMLKEREPDIERWGTEGCVKVSVNWGGRGA